MRTVFLVSERTPRIFSVALYLMETQEVTGNGTIAEGKGRDLKSCGVHAPCGFDPRPRYHPFNELQQSEILGAVENQPIVPEIVPASSLSVVPMALVQECRCVL